MMRKLLLLFFVLTFFTCSNQSTPKGVLPKEKMVPLLVDMHLAEPLYAKRFVLGLPDSSAMQDLYLSFLKKHKVSKKEFESSVFYYGKHPDQYKEIYDEVLERLNKMEIKIKQERPAIKK